ncbi:hypothetical protein U9M48_009150, partial [Paspalum notatum var. saurae]
VSGALTRCLRGRLPARSDVRRRLPDPDAARPPPLTDLTRGGASSTLTRATASLAGSDARRRLLGPDAARPPPRPPPRPDRTRSGAFSVPSHGGASLAASPARSDARRRLPDLDTARPSPCRIRHAAAPPRPRRGAARRLPVQLPVLDPARSIK